MDNCTMFADRNLINRRNVTNDPKSSYRPNRDFLSIVFKSRVIGAAMEVLGFSSKTSTPTKYKLPNDMESLNKASKLQLLHDLSAKIVDKFVFKCDVAERLNAVLSEQEQLQVLVRQELTVDGRFPCRFQGCTRTFKQNGKARRNHELSHDPPVEVDDEPPELFARKPPPPEKAVKSGDDAHNYNCSLLTDCYLFFNFLDAIKEGDGDRLMRQYKYFLLYCRADGQHSTKYALECLYQAFLVHALLSPRDSERFIWNRSVNNHGNRACNIPLDESTEHSNNFIKQCIRNLGPNISKEAVLRLCKAEGTTRNILDNLDDSIQRISRSGGHSHAGTDKDLNELIKRVSAFQPFRETADRKYVHFSDFKRDRLANLDVSALHKWIDKHKRNVDLGVRAR